MRGGSTTSKPKSRTTRTVSTPRKSTSPRGGSSRGGARRPAAKKSSASGPLKSVGRGIGAGWSLMAKGVGATTRTVGKAAEIEQGHRRDGIALGLIAISVVVAGGIWFSAGGPVGEWIETGVRAVFGGASGVLPLIGVAVAVILMRTEPKPEIRPRLVLGSLLVGLPALGLWHIATGSPTDAEGRARGAGFVGYAAGGPLTDGLTVWLAAPLLLMAALFGVLLLTGTTVREVPGKLQSYFGTSFGRDHYADYDSEYYEDGEYDPTLFDADGYPVDDYKTGSRGAPADNYPTDEYDVSDTAKTEVLVCGRPSPPRNPCRRRRRRRNRRVPRPSRSSPPSRNPNRNRCPTSTSS